MSKLDQLKALGDAKRVSRKSSDGGVEGHAARSGSKGIRGPRGTERKAGSSPVIAGVGNEAPARPAGIKPGPSGTKSSEPISVAKPTYECPVCAARRQARAAAQKKWRRSSKGEME
jgi:hypothetical protein